MNHQAITITIPPKIIDNISKYLDLKYEVAGTFKYPKNKESCEITGFRKAKGSSDWVHTPLSDINFHTHPHFLYDRENVRWGWPSGEDLRECMLFGMSPRHLFHVVFTKEGLYTIQTTPCFRKFITGLKPEQAGIVISVLESVFKSTHNLRTRDYNKKYPVRPQDWVKMTREMRIGLLMNEGEETCGKLTCRKIKVTDEQSNVTLLGLADYLKMYEGSTMQIYVVTKKGNIKSTKQMKIEDILESLKKSNEAFKKVCPKSRIFNITFHSK